MSYARTATLLSSAIAMTIVLGAARADVTWAMILAAIVITILAGSLVLEQRFAHVRQTRHRLTGWPALPVQAIASDLARRAEMASPDLFLVNTETPNAFTSGRKRPGSITVTSGLLALLSEKEIRGVLAHEIAHIVQRDARLLPATAIAFGLLGGAAGAALVAAWTLPRADLWVLPVMVASGMTAALCQMAVCRSREFSADRLGARLCGNPLWIAAALEHIDSLDLGKAARTPRTWALETFHFGPRRDRILSLFSTHPPNGARIFRLRRLAGLSDPWD
jgi:heat shock protein HtpX